MPTDGQILKSYADSKKLNKTKLADSLGMTPQNLYQLFKSKKFEPETIEKIEKIFSQKWADILTVNIDDKVDSMVMEDESDYKSLSLRAIINLTESNRSIAESNKSISASNASLARSNEELVRMVKDGSTAGAQSENQKDVDAMRSVVLELLFEVGSGKRWKSADEARAIYRKRLSDVMGLEKGTGIQKSSGKQHIL